MKLRSGSVAQSVEQRPFKALVPGSSPGRPNRLSVEGYILRGDCSYIGATENLQRRIAEHTRGTNHTTCRFDSHIELVVAKDILSMVEALKLERSVKRKRTRDLQSQFRSLRLKKQPTPE